MRSDVRLLRDFEGVAGLNPKIAHRALDLDVAEEELHGPEVSVRL